MKSGVLLIRCNTSKTPHAVGTVVFDSNVQNDFLTNFFKIQATKRYFLFFSLHHFSTQIRNCYPIPVRDLRLIYEHAYNRICSSRYETAISNNYLLTINIYLILQTFIIICHLANTKITRIICQIMKNLKNSISVGYNRPEPLSE